MRKLLFAAAISASVLAPSLARADVARCATGDAKLSFMANDIATQSGDTGWFPSNSDVQLRIEGEITGETTVGMDLAPTACWSDGMSVTAPGTKGSGLLDVQYGADLKLLGQIHVTVLGYTVDWTGQIPIPFLPTDLLLGATTTFDPAALPDSSTPAVSVTDTTSSITVLSTDVIGDLIGIDHLTGGLNLTVQGTMTSTYTSSSIGIAGGELTSATGSTAVSAPAGGYGNALMLTPTVTGNVHYAPGLVFAVTFTPAVFGITITTIKIASIEMPLPAIDRPVTLTATDVDLGLPHLDSVPDALGFASGASQSLTLHNDGAAPLMIESQSAPAGVTAAATTIAPGMDGVVTVTATDTTTVGAAPLVLSTNDPNHATVSIPLDPTTSGQVDPAPAQMAGQGSGCDAGGAAGGAQWLAMASVVALLLSRRRFSV